MRIGQLTRRAAIAALAIVSSATLLTGVAHANTDKSLCHSDETRGSVPAAFPLDACFDGSTLFVADNLDFPVIVNVSGDVGSAQRVPRLGGSLPSAFLSFVTKDNPNVVMPGWEIKIPIGKGGAKVQLATTEDLAKSYAYAKLMWKYAPGISTVRTITELGNELADDANQYMSCSANNNRWGDIGCKALYVRNVAFAAGRAGVSAIATGLAGGIMALLDSADWAKDIANDVTKARQGTSHFDIAAAPEPPKADPPPVQAQQPKPTPSKPQVVPQPHQQPGPVVQPQPAQPTSRTVTIQNKYLVGASGMAEDSVPAYLSTQMQPKCRVNGCMVAGTEMSSGDTFVATCYSSGATMTNENYGTTEDDANPNKVTSSIWLFGTKNGNTGYVSEVYIEPNFRGGAGLPRCP